LAPKFEILNKNFPTVENPTVEKIKFLIGVYRFDSTHNQAVATARMSSETAPVSEPVYDYWD
jgi:hypothetical protein